jgi:hypothetical protein
MVLIGQLETQMPAREPFGSHRMLEDRDEEGLEPEILPGTGQRRQDVSRQEEQASFHGFYWLI